MKRFQDIFFSRRFLLVGLVIFSFVYFNEKVTFLIDFYLVKNDPISNIFIDILVVLIVCLNLFFLERKARKYYKFSFQQYFLVFGFIGVYLFYRLLIVTTWKLDCFYLPHIFDDSPDVNSLRYLDVVVFSFLAYPLFYIVYKVKGKKKESILHNKYFEDNPTIIKRQSRDLVSRITELLVFENPKSSFTIGIIGPWGNGKSSLIKSVREEIKQEHKVVSYMRKPNLEDLLIVNFSPFLNHNIDDILGDFFISLSVALNEYDGSLSNSIIEYSDKLIKLYKKGELKNLLINNTFKRNDLPIYDHYKKIDESIIKVNKKIVVFIDDLDRLSALEILEVLKLIRNTANFSRTIFVVAFDKDYVSKAIKEENAYMDNRFLDKFIQLEVYLPAIQTSELKKHFIDSLRDHKEFNRQLIEDKINALEKSLNENNLFERHVRNYRDSKKVMNQLIFENQFLDNEVLYDEFLTFTLLKLKFPSIIQKLHDRDENFISFDTLEQRYDIVKFDDKDKIQKEYLAQLNDTDQQLLKDTLEALFPEIIISTEIDPRSIRRPDSFYRYTTLSYKSNMLLSIDMSKLFIAPDSEVEALLKEYFQRDHIHEILDRMKFELFNDENKLIRALLISLLIFEKQGVHSIYLMELLKPLKLKENKINIEEIRDWLIQNYLNSEKFNDLNKVEVIKILYTSRKEEDLFKEKKEEVAAIGFQIFDDFLRNHFEKSWENTDFTVFKLYHQLKFITTNKPLNKKMSEFMLRATDIIPFCSQLIDAQDSNSFSISSVVNEMFLKELFLHKVSNSSQCNDLELKEFIDFFELYLITKGAENLIYQFINLELRSFESYPRSSIPYKEKKIYYTQCFFEFIDEDDINYILDVSLKGNFFEAIDIKKYKYEKRFYLKMMFEEKFVRDGIKGLVREIKFGLEVIHQHKRFVIKFTEERGSLITLEGEDVVLLRSLQRN